jgi:hypothetical protein
MYTIPFIRQSFRSVLIARSAPYTCHAATGCVWATVALCHPTRKADRNGRMGDCGSRNDDGTPTVSPVRDGRIAYPYTLLTAETERRHSVQGVHFSASGVSWSSCVAERASWLARKRTASAILCGSANASGETPGRVDPSRGWMPASTISSAT